MRCTSLAIIALTWAGAAVAQGSPTLQQQFDAGEAALGAGRYAEAAGLFAALETKLAAEPKRSPRSLAVARSRLAEAVLAQGDPPRALALATAALPGLAAPGDRALRYDTLRLLGRAEEASLDLGAAARHYREALALVEADDAPGRLWVATAAARAALFDDPAAAARAVEALLPQAEALYAKDRDTLSQFHVLLARARLNAGDAKGADTAIQKALKLAGGLTTRTTILDATARSDAAIIASQLGRDTDVRRYLAYSGAGQGAGSGGELSFPADLDPPPCDDELRPDDRAIVQFSLAENGAVSAVSPVWASRPGPVALGFARAVAGWSWPPEEAAKIKPFYRAAARVELRCTAAPARAGIEALLRAEAEPWIAALGVTLPSKTASAARDLVALRAGVAAEEASSGVASARLVPWLVALADNEALNREETRLAHERAGALARSAGAPAEVIAWLETAAATSVDDGSRASRRALRARLTALRDAVPIAAAPRARAYVQIALAESSSRARAFDDARAGLRAVLATPEGQLATDDPLRRTAAMRLASLEAADGRRDEAVRLFAASGLDPSQCALIDQAPVFLSRGASSDDFPQLVLGFNGWVVTEYDIDAGGRTQGARPLVSYPPFLFNAAATRVVARTKYAPTFRPDGALGCGGYRDRVRFQSAG